MSKVIKIAAVVSLFAAFAPVASAEHVSPWLFPNYSATEGAANVGAQGRSGAVTIQQPQSWHDNNNFARSNPAPVGKEQMVFAHPRAWIKV
jgi:hypothetical protein